MTYPPTGFSLEGLADILKRWRFTDEGRELDFDANVGEQGERLSGGQLQKLELARVSGVYVPVMILDESTSALDPASEQTVVAELVNRFGGNRTIIMITHHENLADMADKLLFVKDGSLFRQGRHAELMADSAAYRRLWG